MSGKAHVSTLLLAVLGVFLIAAIIILVAKVTQP